MYVIYCVNILIFICLKVKVKNGVLKFVLRMYLVCCLIWKMFFFKGKFYVLLRL